MFWEGPLFKSGTPILLNCFPFSLSLIPSGSQYGSDAKCGMPISVANTVAKEQSALPLKHLQFIPGPTRRSSFKHISFVVSGPVDRDSLTRVGNEFPRQRQVGSSGAIAGAQGGGKHAGSQTEHWLRAIWSSKRSFYNATLTLFSSVWLVWLQSRTSCRRSLRETKIGNLLHDRKLLRDQLSSSNLHQIQLSIMQPQSRRDKMACVIWGWPWWDPTVTLQISKWAKSVFTDWGALSHVKDPSGDTTSPTWPRLVWTSLAERNDFALFTPLPTPLRTYSRDDTYIMVPTQPFWTVKQNLHGKFD